LSVLSQGNEATVSLNCTVNEPLLPRTIVLWSLSVERKAIVDVAFGWPFWHSTQSPTIPTINGLLAGYCCAPATFNRRALRLTATNATKQGFIYLALRACLDLEPAGLSRMQRTGRLIKCTGLVNWLVVYASGRDEASRFERSETLHLRNHVPKEQANQPEDTEDGMCRAGGQAVS
jgi:hypothetical protein